MSNFNMVVLVSSYIFYFVMFGYHLLEAFSFLMRDRNGLDPEGKKYEEELEGVDGEKTMIGI